MKITVNVILRRKKHTRKILQKQNAIKSLCIFYYEK